MEISDLFDVNKFKEVILDFDPNASIYDSRIGDFEFFDLDNVFYHLETENIYEELNYFFRLTPSQQYVPKSKSNHFFDIKKIGVLAA